MSEHILSHSLLTIVVSFICLYKSYNLTTFVDVCVHIYDVAASNMYCFDNAYGLCVCVKIPVCVVSVRNRVRACVCVFVCSCAFYNF